MHPECNGLQNTEGHANAERPKKIGIEGTKNKHHSWTVGETKQHTHGRSHRIMSTPIEIGNEGTIKILLKKTYHPYR